MFKDFMKEEGRGSKMKRYLSSIFSILILFAFIAAFALPLTPAIAEDIVGVDPDCADLNIVSSDAAEAPSMVEMTTSVINITPQDPTYVSNCIPFGNNTSYKFTGFIYRNVPSFNLAPGDEIAFDLGSLNNVDIRRNIYFATANKNPGPPIHDGYNITVSQDIKATQWIQIVSDTQTPMNSQGNNQCGDYELIYIAETAFNFPGGGLIVGFGGSPPGSFADTGCEQVLCCTTSKDSSGLFYSRFYHKDHLTLDTLDNIFYGGSAIELGGIMIEANGGLGCDLTPVLKALDLVEAKLDSLGKLPYIIEDLFHEVMRLNKAVYMLEVKLDIVQKEFSVARDERAAIESKLDNGEVVTQSDLTDGLGGVWFPGAKKMGHPGPPNPTP